MAAPTSTTPLETPLPSATTLLTAAKLAQQLDRPIQLDYYADTCIKKAVIGEDPDSPEKEKILIKNNDEYTSLIKKVYKAGDDFIVLTENSIYIVSGKVERRKLNVAALLGSD
jgi:hypothetical protein